MRLRYSRDLVANSKAEGEPYERGEPEIDIAGRRVFVGSSDGGLYALKAAQGEILWRFQTLSFVQSKPLYEPREDVLYFGSHDGALYKVHAASGELIWRLATNAEVARQPIIEGGVLYFANANDTLLAVNPKDGQIIWDYHRTPALGMEIAGYSGPAVGHGLVYMGFSDGTATAFDAVSGEERWNPVDLAGEAEEILGDIPPYLDVDTTPVLFDTQEGPLVAFGSYEGGVFALDADGGTAIWTRNDAVGVSDLSFYEEPPNRRDGILRPARRLLLVSTGTTGLWALDPENGNELWRRSLPHGGISRPAALAGTLMINSSQLGVYLISPVDGSLIDGIHFDHGASGNPVGYGRRAFMMTNGGTFLALDIEVPGPYKNAPNYSTLR